MTIYQCPLVQTVQSIGVQCNLLAAPPLQKLKVQEDSDRHTSDPEDTDLTDLDTSFQLSQEDTTTE